MKTEINPPQRSKININAGVTSAVNVGVYVLVNRGVIPHDAVVDALVIGNVASQCAQFVFRTWFTKP